MRTVTGFHALEPGEDHYNSVAMFIALETAARALSR
jgi:hypothetical protein